MNNVLFFYFKGIHLLDAVRTNVTKVLTGQKFWVEPHPLLKHSWFWWYFRTLVGQFDALLPMLRLIWEDEAAPSPSNQRYFAIWCYFTYRWGFFVSFFVVVGENRDILSAQPLWLDDAFVCSAKVKKKTTLIQKSAFHGVIFAFCVPNQKFVIYFLCKLLMRPVCKGRTTG